MSSDLIKAAFWGSVSIAAMVVLNKKIKKLADDSYQEGRASVIVPPPIVTTKVSASQSALQRRYAIADRLFDVTHESQQVANKAIFKAMQESKEHHP